MLDWPHLLLVFLQQLTGFAAVPTTHKWLWTYYPSKTTWNDGNVFCRSNHDRLLKFDSTTRANVLHGFKDNEWSSVFKNNFWIGLYYKSPSKQWNGLCNDFYETHAYNKWKSGEVVNGEKPCTMVDKGTFEWTREVCKQDYEIICEEDLGQCSFVDANSKCHNNRESNGKVVSSFAACKEECRQWMVNDEECWAVTYFQSTNTCYGTFGNNPNNIHSASILTTCSDASVSFKVCFEAVVSNKNVHKTYEGDEKVKNIQCYTTTAATTTTPSPSSTTALSTMKSIFSTGKITATTTKSLPTTNLITTLLPVQMISSTTHVKPSSSLLYNLPGMVTTTTAGDTISPVWDNNTICSCKCNDTSNSLQDNLVKITSYLQINKRMTSKWRKQLECAYDNRVSAKRIGWSGVFILVALFSIILLTDCYSLFNGDFNI